MGDFLDRPDISYITPGRKDVVYLGRTGREKRYILWNLKDLHEIANGNPYLIQVSASFYERKSKLCYIFNCFFIHVAINAYFFMLLCFVFYVCS